MPNSIFDNTVRITENLWAVSVVNTGSKIGGHACIVVEGLKETVPSSPINKHVLFVGEYDITAATDEKAEQNSQYQTTKVVNCSGVTGTEGDVRGIIINVRCYESNSYSDHAKKKSTCQSITYSISKERAEQMIKSIKDDNERTKAARETGQVGDFIKYQFFGSDSFLGTREEGVNCAEWVKEKLKVANINCDDTKSKPEKVAGGSCVIS